MGVTTGERPIADLRTSDVPLRQRVSGRTVVIAVAVVAVVAGILGWRWLHSLPVPVVTANGGYHDPIPVGETVNFAIYGPTGTSVQLDRVELGLANGSSPADLEVALCERAEGSPLIESSFGAFPRDACDALEPVDGQRLEGDRYLVVSADLLGPGKLRIVVDVHARDGIRSGVQRIVIGPHEVGR